MLHEYVKMTWIHPEDEETELYICMKSHTFSQFSHLNYIHNSYFSWVPARVIVNEFQWLLVWASGKAYNYEIWGLEEICMYVVPKPTFKRSHSEGWVHAAKIEVDARSHRNTNRPTTHIMAKSGCSDVNYPWYHELMVTILLTIRHRALNNGRNIVCGWAPRFRHYM